MTTRIVLLPGLGADERLFAPQLEAFESATMPGWIEPRTDRHGPRGARGESLGDYALRFAEQAVQPEPGEDWVAVGFSFGAQVALEMASRLPEGRRPRAVGLISGLRSRRSVSRLFRMQVRLGTAVPERVARAVIAGPLSGLFARSCGLDPRQTADLHAMAEDVDWAFLVWASRAASRWASDGRCPVPVSWIHGRRDRVVPYVPHPAQHDRVELLDDGSHLLTWTKAARVNAWIAGILGGN
jgi:pimeloyl-ACP methyl ester carboxylesterase